MCSARDPTTSAARTPTPATTSYSNFVGACALQFIVADVSELHQVPQADRVRIWAQVVEADRVVVTLSQLRQLSRSNTARSRRKRPGLPARRLRHFAAS
jgi:hypothetical protein